MIPTPVEFRRLETRGLAVTWSDGARHELTSLLLRQNCPCAGCREKRGDESHSKPLGGPGVKRSLMIVESTIDEETNLVRIWPVGQYALGLEWGDGHATGIYPYALLRELGEGRSPASAHPEV